MHTAALARGRSSFAANVAACELAAMGASHRLNARTSRDAMSFMVVWTSCIFVAVISASDLATTLTRAARECLQFFSVGWISLLKVYTSGSLPLVAHFTGLWSLF